MKLQVLRLPTNPLWMARLAWSEMHGASMPRWHLDEAVGQVGGMLSTDSRGIFFALTRSESPQLRLRSSRTREEARGLKEQCAVSNARIHWVKHFDDVGRQSDQTWISRSCSDGTVPGQETMETHFSSYLRVQQTSETREPLFNDDDVNDINPVTDPIAFDTLLQDESPSDDVRVVVRMKYE